MCSDNEVTVTTHLKKHRDNPENYFRGYILTSEQFEVAYNAFERTCNTHFNVKACRYGVDGHDSGNHEYYNVKDGTVGKRFKVDLRNWANGCSCHIHERQQIPCTHIIAALIELKQYQLVWGFVGSVYSLQSLGARAERGRRRMSFTTGSPSRL